MPRIQHSQPVILKRTSYTPKELDALFQEVNGDLSHRSKLNWLMKNRAINIRPYGKSTHVVVLQHSDGSFPYSDLSEKWEALVTRENKKSFARKEQDKSYEHLVNSLPNTLFNI